MTDHSVRYERFRIPMIAMIVLLGALLRFRHLNWAQGYYFQPDESVHTVEYSLHLPASLNPYQVGPYTYGGLPLYLYHFTAQVLRYVTGNPAWTGKWPVTVLVRAYAAAASTMAIVVNYALAKRLGLQQFSWVAALGLAVSPLAIQYAHYGVVESLLTLWTTLSSLIVIEAWFRDRLIYWMIAGLVIGFAIATKSSGAVWTLSIIAATGGYWARRGNWQRALAALVVGCAGVLAGAAIGSPFYFLDWSRFHQVMTMQAAKTVTGQALCTYHWQFLNVMPFIFQARQLMMWAIGLPLATLGLAGAALMWRHALRPPTRTEWLLLLAPPTAYFIVICLWHSKFIRYLLPILPYMSIAAAYLAHAVPQSGRVVTGKVVSALTIGALLYSGFLGVAISNVYAGPDPRVKASDWMVRNIPAGTTILHDPEPLITLPLGHTEEYQIQVLDLYGNRMRNINNPEFYARSLQDKQFVVIVSRRNYRTILHLSALFPHAACYYRSVFDGSLGYELRAEFTNYPHLGPFVWNTDQAEETFQVFDHPHVFIFERTKPLDLAQIRSLLNECGK